MDIFKSILASAFQIIGSLGLFIYGMKLMSDGLQKSAGERIQAIINWITGNRFKAVATGFLVTAIIQSSSATTVMVVSFANAGLISLFQSIGVIMGANIGTTVTGWIVSLLGFHFDIALMAVPAVGIGVILLFLKKSGAANWGETIIGFGLLFLGLNYLKESVPDIGNNTALLESFRSFTDWGYLSILVFTAIGLLITVVVQSSSAVLAITLTVAFSGWIDYPQAAAIAIGSNIGTTVTALLASIGASVNAKRASLAHFLFNAFGALWVLILFYPFLHIIDLIVPGDPNINPADIEAAAAAGIPYTNAAITLHLSAFHTIFNCINTLLFIGPMKYLEKLIIRLMPDKKNEKPGYELKFISASFREVGEINIINARYEIQHMFQIVIGMFDRFYDIFKQQISASQEDIDKQIEDENFTDRMQEQISLYLIECSNEEINEQSHSNVSALLRITDELESIADSCLNLSMLSRKQIEKQIAFTPEQIDELTPYCGQVRTFLMMIANNLKFRMPSSVLKTATQQENEINDTQDKLKHLARTRIENGSNVRAEFLYLDFVKHLEHIGDYSMNISEELNKIH